MKKWIHIVLVVFFSLAISSVCGADGTSNMPQHAKQKLCLKHCDVDMEYEEAIRDRLQTGFNNWNQGYEAWLEWCNELYDENAYYNVYGHRLTLAEYQGMMGLLFAKYDITLGALDNVLVNGDWTAIRYTVYFEEKGTGVIQTLNTMEFVKFRKDEEFGAKVLEGWAISDNELTID